LGGLDIEIAEQRELTYLLEPDTHATNLQEYIDQVSAANLLGEKPQNNAVSCKNGSIYRQDMLYSTKTCLVRTALLTL
jgi:hypothetical protein